MRSKTLLRVSLILMLSIGLSFPAFTCSKCGKEGVSKLNIWVSDVADPCGTLQKDGKMTILDCKGVLHWPCGRFLAPNGQWEPVPNNGEYRHLPFKCGHIEVEVPPGSYWVVSGTVIPQPEIKDIYFNYTTHVGIVQVLCGESACVKLFNPSKRLCWYWFRTGLMMDPVIRRDPEKIKKVETLVAELLKDVPPPLPAEKHIEGIFDELIKSAAMQQMQEKK